MDKIRMIPDILMDILRDYPDVRGGEKPLLDYVDEILKSYQGLSKEMMELEIYQEQMNKDIDEMKQIAMKFKKMMG